MISRFHANRENRIVVKGRRSPRRCAAVLFLSAAVFTLCPAGTVQTGKHPRAAALLQYLNSMPERESGRSLVGQYTGGDGNLDAARSNVEDYVYALDNATGHKPVVLEFSLFQMFSGNFIGNRQGIVDLMEKMWNEGHILYVAMRPPNAETGGAEHSESSGEATPDDLATVYTPGNYQYDTYREDLAQAGDILDFLKQRNIPVLWEPYNELSGSWNWFYPSPAEKFVELWKYAHGYLTDERGLDNLLWVWEWHSSQPLDWDRYPGDEFVDVFGLSVYDTDPGDKYTDFIQSMSERGKPVGFSEFGPNLQYAPPSQKPNPPYYTWDNMIMAEALRDHYPEASFFIRWNTVWATVNQNNAEEFMSHEWLIDLDEFAVDLPGILEGITGIRRLGTGSFHLPEIPIAVYSGHDIRGKVLPFR